MQALGISWGLLALLNVVTRAVLTAPGPLNLIHTEVPDRMIGTFPFLLIPGFFVPLAVVLHILAIRSIRGSLRAAYQARKEVSIRPAMTNTRNLHGLREGLPDEG